MFRRQDYPANWQHSGSVVLQPASSLYLKVQYQDIGLTLKLTPHILRSTNVSLDMEFKLQALSGMILNGDPN